MINEVLSFYHNSVNHTDWTPFLMQGAPYGYVGQSARAWSPAVWLFLNSVNVGVGEGKGEGGGREWGARANVKGGRSWRGEAETVDTHMIYQKCVRA